MYKVFTQVGLGVMLASAGVAQAELDQNQQLIDCKEQLASIYGEDVRVRISGKAAVTDSALKLLVYPKGERLLRLSCARSSDGGLDMMDRYGMALALPEKQEDILSPL